MCCSKCFANKRTKKREFSDQAIAALVVWGELEAQAVGQAICDDCYEELRELLMDRNDEISQVKADSSNQAS